MNKTIRPSLLLVLALLQLGCGPNVLEVLKEHEGQFAQKREQFNRIAGALSSGNTRCAAMNPPLIFNRKTKQFNAEVVMFEHLADPDAEPKFNLLLNGDLLTAVRWTGPKNPLSPSVLDEGGDDIRRTLENALGYRYLVVNRVTGLVEPEARSESTYTPGRVTLEAHIVDLSNDRVLCALRFSGQSAPDVSYYYKQGESQQGQLQKFAHSTLWESARQNFAAALRSATGGEVEVGES